MPDEPRWNEMIDGSIRALWTTFGSSDSLLPDLAFDAVLARADHGEFPESVPRLFELGTAPGADPDMAVAVFDRLEGQDWSNWPDGRRRPVEHLLDQWWAMLLRAEPGVPAVHEVLAALVRLNQPVIRWLQPWLEDLDGPGARHLALLVINELSSPRWAEVPDRREQVLAWTRSEPVLMGLTLVGGVHLEPGELSEALDRML